MATQNGKTLVGNNEDHYDPNTQIWFQPASEGNYGCVLFIAGNKVQGGMNDQGLVGDGFRTERMKVRKKKTIYQGNILRKVLEECATVEEVIKVFEEYTVPWIEYCQLMFVDKTGDSVIIEGDDIQKKRGNFQVATNFYLSQLKEGDVIPCERYNIVTEMLKNNDITIDTFRKILAAIHVEIEGAATVYSNIYDVNNGLVYVYHFHNFENVVIIDLEEELKKGQREIDLSSLFPKTFAADMFKKIASLKQPGLPILGLVICFFVFLSIPLFWLGRFIYLRILSQESKIKPPKTKLSERITKTWVNISSLAGICGIMLILVDFISTGAKIKLSPIVALTAAFLALGLLILSILAWKDRLWYIFDKILISSVSLAFFYLIYCMQRMDFFSFF
jgi:hypothetical protein